MSMRRQTGFTLIETLVAFTLLMLSLTVLIATFSQGTRALARTAHYETALQVASSIIASSGTVETLHPGNTQGVTPDGMNWRLRVAELKGDFNLNRATPLTVEVEVSWDEGVSAGSVQLRTMKIVPGGVGAE